MVINFYNLSLNFSNFLNTYKSVQANLSIMRITHNFFLNKIQLNGKIANIGSGKNIYIHKFFKKFSGSLYSYDFYKLNKDIIKINLEKRFVIKNGKFDCIILFNVLEHINNYKNLISSLKLNLKSKGRLEIFVPFMFRYHKDPKDIFRPTHYYLNELLKSNGFKTKITLINAGPIMVILEILFKYLKFSSIKLFLLFIFLIFDKIFLKFSKDYLNYYSGTHISCIKK